MDASAERKREAGRGVHPSQRWWRGGSGELLRGAEEAFGRGALLLGVGSRALAGLLRGLGKPFPGFACELCGFRQNGPGRVVWPK